MTEAFILGMDASIVPSLEAGGVRYYDFDGREKDVFEILSEINLCFFVCSAGVKLFPFNNAVCHRRIFPRSAVVECRLRDRYSQNSDSDHSKYDYEYPNPFCLHS